MSDVRISFLGTGAGASIHRAHTAIVLDCADNTRLLLDASSGNSVLRYGAELGIMAESFEHIRTCHLCEAMCGLRLTVEDGRVTRIRSNPDDVWSQGYICPKGTVLGQLNLQPANLRRDPVTQARLVGLEMHEHIVGSDFEPCSRQCVDGEAHAQGESPHDPPMERDLPSESDLRCSVALLRDD